MLLRKKDLKQRKNICHYKGVSTCVRPALRASSRAFYKFKGVIVVSPACVGGRSSFAGVHCKHGILLQQVLYVPVVILDVEGPIIMKAIH